MTTAAQHQLIAPASNRWESLLLALSILILILCTAIYAEKYGIEEKVQTILDWQISAYSGLQGVDQGIYNELVVAADEIYWMQYFNGHWPIDEEFQEDLLPPFYRDESWKRNGSLNWTLKDVVQEGEAQGLTLYHGNNGSIEGQGAFVLVIDHKHAGGSQVSSANVWWHPDSSAPIPPTSKTASIILHGWKEVIPYQGRDEYERLNSG